MLDATDTTLAGAGTIYGVSTVPVGPSPLVTAEALRALLRGDGPGPAPVVLDVRWHLGGPSGEEDFDAGHIPGAVFVDLDADLAGPPGPAGRHPLPDPDSLQDTLRRAGVDRESSVVVYDGGRSDSGMGAARAWWVLRWAGLAPERVAVLDGGFPAWVEAGGETTTAGRGAAPFGDVGVAGGGMPVLSADAAAALGTGEGVLLDARAPERFAGETEPIDPVAGHVPGAVNLPAASLLRDDGRFRPPEELAQRLAPVVGDTGGSLGAYCGSGVSASILVLALEIAGLRPASEPAGLYVGSWSHWSRSAKRPVETGPSGGAGAGAGG